MLGNPLRPHHHMVLEVQPLAKRTAVYTEYLRMYYDRFGWTRSFRMHADYYSGLLEIPRATVGS